MGHVLRLHGRVHHHGGKLGRRQRLGLRRHGKAFLDQRVQALLAHALPPARHRGAIEDEPVLEELLAAEILKIRVLGPDLAKALVRQVLAVLQDVKPRHQPRRQRRTARPIRINRPKGLLEKSPIDPLRQPYPRTGHVDDLVEPGLEQIPLAVSRRSLGFIPSPKANQTSLEPRMRGNFARKSAGNGATLAKQRQENRPKAPA